MQNVNAISSDIIRALLDELARALEHNNRLQVEVQELKTRAASGNGPKSD